MRRTSIRHIVIVAIVLLAFNVFVTYMNLYGSPLPYISSVSPPCPSDLANATFLVGMCPTVLPQYIEKITLINAVNGHEITVLSTNNVPGMQITIPLSNIGPGGFAYPTNNTMVVASFVSINNSGPYLMVSVVNLTNDKVNNVLVELPFRGNSTVSYWFSMDGSLYLVHGYDIYVLMPLQVLVNNKTIAIYDYLIKYSLLGNGTIKIMWTTKLPLSFLSPCCGGGIFNRSEYSIITANDKVIITIPLYSLSSMHMFYSLLILNANNGSILYYDNMTFSPIHSAVVGSAYVFLSNGSIYGINLTATRPYVYLILRNYSGYVFPTGGNYAILMWQGNGTTYVMKFNIYGNIYWKDEFKVDEYSWINPLSKYAVVIMGSTGFGYGEYGQRQAIIILNLGTGKVVHEIVRYLRIPLINSPDPTSHQPLTFGIDSSGNYLLYQFGNELYVTNEQLIVNDWPYYLIFDDMYLVFALWILWIVLLYLMTHPLKLSRS